MGLLVDGTCYADEELAGHLYAGSMPPVTFSGTDGFHTYVLFYRGDWEWEWIHYLEGEAVGTVPGFNNVQGCDPAENFQDGVELGWGVAAVLIAAAAVMLLRRTLR